MSVELKLSNPYEVRSLISTQPAVSWQPVLRPERLGISSTVTVTRRTKLSSQGFAGRLVLMRKAPKPQESTHGFWVPSMSFLSPLQN